MCEWNTGRTEVQLFHIDGKHNLADLLTKKHELSVESVTQNSVWQTGLPWMRLGHPIFHQNFFLAEIIIPGKDEPKTGIPVNFHHGNFRRKAEIPETFSGGNF